MSYDHHQKEGRSAVSVIGLGEMGQALAGSFYGTVILQRYGTARQKRQMPW